VGGTGGFTLTDVDTLWSGALPGVTLDAASLVGIDTSAGDTAYATSQATRGLVKLGANTLTLTGANTYGGGTFVQAGVLAITNTGALPGWDTGGRYWVSRDAGLAVGNAISDAELETMTGTGNFADGGCFGFDTTVSNRTYTGVLSNTVNGALGLVKVGTNTLTLTGTNTYDGNTFVNGGILVVKNSNALGSSNGYTVVNRVGGTPTLYTDATGQVRLDGGAGNLTVNENFIINGDQQYGYGGALRSSAGNNTINGWIVVGVTGSGSIGLDAGNLTLNGPILRLNAAANPMLVLNSSAGFLIVSNTVSIGSGLVNFHSAGTIWMCSASNTWGSAQIQYGGVLRLGADEAMAVGKRVTMGNPEPGNGKLDLYGYSQTIGGLTEYGTAASKPNNIITNGRPSSVSTLTVSQTAGTADFFSGRLLGALGLVKAGAANSVLTLAGVNTFTGDTGLAGGTLAVSNQFALAGSTLNFTNGSGAVRFGAGLTAFTFGGLSGSVGFGLTNTQGQAVTLTVGSNSASTVYSGNLSGAGGLAKAGSGTLTLAGLNTYGGATTLTAGTLALGAAGAASPNSTLVLAGGTLQANGYSAAFGPLQVSGGGTIALGDGTGTLSFANSSGQTWAGLVDITGVWAPTSLRVGTGSGGLSEAHTHSFSYNGDRVWVQVDANGYLWKMSGTLMMMR
jgi:autotransporter-associated beta strand protein